MIFSFITIPRFSRGRVMNKNTSLGPSRGQQHQNFSTIRADLESTSHDVQEGEGKKGSSSHHRVCVRERNTLNKY
jgi:hypothetical protein